MEEEEEQDLVQRILMVALVDTITSVLMVIGTIFGVHVHILLAWKLLVNRRYYNFLPQGPTRIIHVTKQPGERLGISLHGEHVRELGASSPMAPWISPGDRILLINGQRVKNGKHAATLIYKVCEACVEWRTAHCAPAVHPLNPFAPIV